MELIVSKSQREISKKLDKCFSNLDSVGRKLVYRIHPYKAFEITVNRNRKNKEFWEKVGAVHFLKSLEKQEEKLKTLKGPYEK